MSEHNLKVGDKLAVRSRLDGIVIHTVDRITASGRIKCGRLELNPDLSIRGANKWGPSSAEIITDEIREALAIQNLARQSRRWFETIKAKVPREHRQRVYDAIEAAMKSVKEGDE